MKPPVMIMCCTGQPHLKYCVWAVRSLRKFNYAPIEILVDKEEEKQFLHDHLGDIQIEVMDVDLKGYRMWAWRPFALERYEIKHKDRDVVICDVDILWKQDPFALFKRFEGKPWIHKITSLDPAELDDYAAFEDVPKRRIGLRTMIGFKNSIGLKRYPNFHLNCGLLMLPRESFKKVADRWGEVVRSVPPEQMIMTEALLALIYSELGLQATSDRVDIKHLGIKHRAASVPVVKFEVAPDPVTGQYTGYQTAKHYFGEQRAQFHRDAVAMGLDEEGFAPALNGELRAKERQKLWNLPKRVLNKLFSSVSNTPS